MLHGKSVNLRVVKEADVATLFHLSSDLRDAGEFMPVALTSESRYWAEYRDTGFWHDNCGKLIIENESGDIVGEAGFFKAAHYLDGREVYYRIFTGHRGKGYAGEALSLLSKLFFESTSMSRLQAVTIVGNQVSEHLLKKAGFQFEGCMRQARYFKGQLVDLNMFALTRHHPQ